MTLLSAEPRAADVMGRPGRAFGLDLDVGFACPGLPQGASGEGPTVRFGIVPRAQFPNEPDGIVSLREARRPDGRVALRLAHDEQAGYWFSSLGYGRFHISADGTNVTCCPVRGAAWRWQRFLVGQVFPLLAVVHGYEVFHASVVRLGDRTIAFTGHSRAGKSTLATALVLSGARFVTDDVAVIAVDDARGGNESLRVHHGFGLSSVRHETVASLGESIEELGLRVGADDEAVRVAVDVDRGDAHLTDLFFVNRAQDATGSVIERIAPVDPRLLLASGYNYAVRSRERLERHLDVCARIANSVDCYQLTIGPGDRPADTVAAVRAHFTS